jgi:uncharacterized protein YndB with AHSA1/START domain
MAELRVTVEVAAPVDQVWAAVTDWARQGEWMLGTTVAVTEGDGESTGSRLRAVTGKAPLAFADPMVITEWDPPRRCTVEHLGRVVRGAGVFEVRPRSGGAELVWTELLDLPLGPVGRLGWPVVRPAFRWGVAHSLNRFARWAERYPSRYQ